MADRIPCTVVMLTYNSAPTLARALESLTDFEEVILADGGSQDATRQIARGFGRTVVEQSPEAKGADGKLLDFGLARDNARSHVTQPWIMELDSDEYATADLVARVREVCASDSPHSAYTLESRYEYRGRIIDCATTYPMRFLKLYRTEACIGYKGVIDEEALVTGTTGEITSYFVKPYPSLRVMLPKWFHYLHVTRVECAGLDHSALVARAAFRRSEVRWFLRSFRSKRSRNLCQNSLPVHLELIRVLFYFLHYSVAMMERGKRAVRLRSDKG